MKAGSRKFTIAILGLIAFTIIMLFTDTEPISLGTGLGAFILPIMYGYAKEYQK